MQQHYVIISYAMMIRGEDAAISYSQYEHHVVINYQTPDTQKHLPYCICHRMSYYVNVIRNGYLKPKKLSYCYITYYKVSCMQR